MKWIGKIVDIAIPLLFHTLFLFVPLFFTNVNDELFEFNKMLAVYVIALLLVFFYICRCILAKKILWKRTLLDIPIVLFLGSQLLSTIFSIHLRTSLFGYYSRFNGGLFSLLSYIWIYYAFINLIEPKQIKSFITSLLIGGALSSLYAFPEHFGHSPSCLLFSGKFDDACWVQDVRTRIFGTFGQPNWLSAYMGMLIPIALVQFILSLQEKAKTVKRWAATTIYALLALLFTLVDLYTNSRSGIAGELLALLFLGGSIIVFFFFAQNHLRKKIKASIVVSVLGILFFLLLTVQSRILSSSKTVQDFLAKIHINFQTSQQSNSPSTTQGGNQLEIGGSESGQIRAVVWKGALDVWRRYPVFGSGVETFAYSYFKDRPKEHNLLSEWDFLYNKAHNEFLNFLATTGTVGLFSYLVLIIALTLGPLFVTVHLYRSKKIVSFDLFLFVCAFTAGLFELHISNFFGFSTVMVCVLMYIFPAMLLKLIEWEKEKKSTPTTLPQFFSFHQNEVLHGDQISIIAVAGILIAIPILYVFKSWNADRIYALGKQSEAIDPQGAFLDLKQATEILPSEPTFHDELSVSAAQLAISFAKAGDSTSAAQLATYAIQESDTTIQQNPVHTNFYKSRTKVFFILAQLDPSFYANAQQTLLKAEVLSPTDPKLVYNLALIQLVYGNDEMYRQLLLKALDLRPIDYQMRTALATSYEKDKQYQKALEQYQYVLQYIDPNNATSKQHIASISAILRK